MLCDCFKDKASNDLLSQAIIVGRFDKKKFDLKNSLILGEDGGLFLLLNRLTKEQQKDMIEANIITETYLKDKIKNRQEDKDKIGDKVILGQGGFGKVKFALSLFGDKARSGDVVCIKKTSNFEDLAPKHGEMVPSALQSATQATMEDYFASSIADKVYAPRIFDLAIVAARELNEASLTHQKGYLMMEIFPQNTATKIFKESKYQLWKYQKPFLREIMLSTSELLKERIAFTDLKSDNALFDPDTFKTTIIDLGGTIKVAVANSLDSFDKSKYSCQITEGYCAPEMQDMNIMTISLPKALAYTCGKVIEEVVQNSDYNRQELKRLINMLTNPKPDQRITIEDALKKLKEMGDDTNNEDILLHQYIAKIKGRIENNRSSISLNEDILITKELYIDLKITDNDPEKHNDQETEDLFQRIDRFFAGDHDQQQVMVLFGSAGSGKSIALQLKFIEAIQKWSKGQALPIYFNLANGIDLKTIINSMNAELGTNLKLQELKNDVHLYIDSFDEGLEIEKKRETLIREYMAELKNSRTKIIITCRSNYLDGESNRSWFTPQVNAFDKLVIKYVAPMNYIACKNDYRGEENEEEKENEVDLDWKRNVTDYLGRESKNRGIQINQKDIQETVEKMARLNLDQLIDTGLMFHIVMEVLSELLENKSESSSRSKQDVYLKYVTKYQKEELDKLTEEQKTPVTEYTKFISKSQEKESNLIKAINDIGKYLAVQLHLRGIFRLEQDTSIFQALGYESRTPFKKQVPWHILKLLPLKIETKHSSNNPHKNKSQEVKVGFIHDTFKNCYLLDAIQEEMLTQNGNSQILASKSIISDLELIKFIADAARHDNALRNYLRKGIDFTKNDKSESAAVYAANCITILVSARHLFLGQDLSNINIKGANLKNGIFYHVDFTGADLSHTSLRNMQADGVTFRKANLIGAKLGILPDLKGHYFCVRGVSFSSDGKYVASGSVDKTVKIWELETNKCLVTLQGHKGDVNSVGFSSDGKYVASCSYSTIKIWDLSDSANNFIALADNEGGVSSVSFSGDGKYVASGSAVVENAVKIWEIETNKCLVTLQGHTSSVTSVSFLGDGKYVASCSYDKTVKIWEVQTKRFLATLQGHTGSVYSVSFSGDGKYVTSSSGDSTVKIWSNCSGKWLLDGHLGDSEAPLSMNETVIEETAVSIQNQKVFEQCGAIIKHNKIATDVVIETEHSSALALLTAEKLNEQLLTIQITAYKKLERQKIVQVHIAMLLNQTEQNKKNNNEALAHNEKTDQQKVSVQQNQNDDSFKTSSAIGAKSDNNKARVFAQDFIEKQQEPQLQSRDKKMYESNKGKSACCSLF